MIMGKFLTFSGKLLVLVFSNRQTVIHFCAAQNFVEFLQDLAELGASVDMADNKGESYSQRIV